MFRSLRSYGVLVMSDLSGPVGDTQPTVWDDRPRFALDADVTVYWPDVRPCWEESDHA